jgi:hypothetical protein
MVQLDPKVWGPHMWFFLHTISMTYPVRPNAVTKKIYYEIDCTGKTFTMIANWKRERKERRREEKNCLQGARRAKHLTLSVCAIHIVLYVWTVLCFVG